MTEPTTPAQVWARHFAEMRKWLDPAVAEAADPAAAETRGYRKAITALREGAKSKLIPPEKAAALSEAVGWLETYLEAIAEEDKP